MRAVTPAATSTALLRARRAPSQFFKAAERFCLPQQRQDRPWSQIGELAEGGNGLIGIAGRKLRASEGGEQQWVVRYCRICMLSSC